ncbi:MAG: hypothetical protein IJ449_02705 [Clostridia bacterium]|nr:hypothetical protein [Clostridia bacterium]
MSVIPTLPAAFCEHMKHLLGSNYDAFLSAYNNDAQRGLRVNPYKCDTARFLGLNAFPLRPTAFEENGFYLDCTEAGTGNHPLHHAGAFYLQEPAAMLPIAAAGAFLRPGDFVLDVCAAPGGKSTQLAAKIGAGGLLVSNEFVPSRAKILLSNIERLGIPNAVVTNTDAAHLRMWYAGCFDCVVVDAPCSGEGMFRKNPQAIAEWSEDNVRMCAERSLGILSDAQDCLRPGGILVYATCTFAPEENEELIARFLMQYPGYTVEILPECVRRVTSPGLPVAGCSADLSRSARCYPHITGGEGQFVCILRKDGDAPRRTIPSNWEKMTKEETAMSTALLRELFSEKIPQIKKRGGILYAVPEQMAVSGNCFSLGVRLGESKGSRIAPHHQLFSAYGGQMRRKWNLSSADPRVLRYLHGETITVSGEDSGGESGDGFGCVMVDGCALGGAKRVGDTLKNHYPKGLRIQGI